MIVCRQAPVSVRATFTFTNTIGRCSGGGDDAYKARTGHTITTRVRCVRPTVLPSPFIPNGRNNNRAGDHLVHTLPTDNSHTAQLTALAATTVGAPSLHPLTLSLSGRRTELLYSRAPARVIVRYGPPRAERRARVFEARRGRVTRSGQRAIDQRREFVRCAVRGGR